MEMHEARWRIGMCAVLTTEELGIAIWLRVEGSQAQLLYSLSLTLLKAKASRVRIKFVRKTNRTAMDGLYSKDTDIQTQAS